MANGLFLPDGSFQPFRAADMHTELATRQNAGITLDDLADADKAMVADKVVKVSHIQK